MEFVNYDLAKKLKEKKFNEPCFGYYHIDKGDDSFEVCGNGDYDFFNNINYWRIGAPRIAQVLKWLREEKNLHICISIGLFSDFEYEVSEIEGNVHCYSDDKFSTYEQAALAGIKYVLDNLI